MFRILELFRTVVMTTVLNNSKVLNLRMIKNFKILEHYVLYRFKPSFGRHPIIFFRNFPRVESINANIMFQNSFGRNVLNSSSS
jgi:hypothetical protein